MNLINIEQMQIWLKTIRGGQSNHIFQIFGDSEAAKKRIFPQVLVGTLDESLPALRRASALGAGIFVAPNDFEGNERKKEKCTRFNSVWADFDGVEELPKFPIKPHMIIKTANGFHVYWKIQASDPREFEAIQSAIAHMLGSDPSVKDPSRVMRLAGFPHQKDPSSPKETLVLSIGEHPEYSLVQVKNAFKVIPMTKVKNAISKMNGRHKESYKSFMRWVKKQDFREGAQNSHGGRNNVAMKIARECESLKLSEEQINEIKELLISLSGLPAKEVDQVFKAQNGKDFKVFYGPKGNMCPADVADLFLESEDLISNGLRSIHYLNGNFYIYNKNDLLYRGVSPLDFSLTVTEFIKTNPELRKKSKNSFISDVVTNVKSTIRLPEQTEFSTFVGEDPWQGDHLIPLKNGLLNLTDLVRGKEPRLRDHTPAFFNSYVLPINYVVGAQCPLFLKFLEQALPDEDSRKQSQEWIGSHFIRSRANVVQHFMLLHGEGGNGKSVLCCVHRTLLGFSNVSGLAIEGFSQKSRFEIAQTVGKIANISEEIGELARADEAGLKNYTGGGTVTVERKHQQPFSFLPTAKLTFATNNLPRFTDRSDGLWRRMLLLHFPNQFLDPSKQNKNLVSDQYWIESGELPGILNWALEGATRFLKQGHFTMPAASNAMINEYKLESNPARTFLLEFCFEAPEYKLPTSSLFSYYKDWCHEHGYHHLNIDNFNKEVVKAYKRVIKHKNPISVCGIKSRCWEGINYKRL